MGPRWADPARLLERLLTGWVAYARSGTGPAEGVDLMPVALHGWSHAQTDPELLATLGGALVGFRERCVPVIEQRQAEAVVAADADPRAVAQLLLSICLGFAAQRTLTGDADIKAHAAALAALLLSAERTALTLIRP